MSKLQREKGKRGEIEVKNIFASHGFEDAHRSQQFSGKGESSADVVGVDGLHLEVKLGYSYKTIYDFREQAEREEQERLERERLERERLEQERLEREEQERLERERIEREEQERLERERLEREERERKERIETIAKNLSLFD